MKISENSFYHSLQDTLSSTSLNMGVALRILSILREHGHTNKTNLAGKSGLNYSRCVKYVKILMMLGWIKIVFDDDNYLAITDKGIEIVNRLSIM